MTGTPDMPGLTPSAITEMYRLITEKAHCVCKVSTYFVELYNDQLVDLYLLLDRRKNKIPANTEIPKLDIKMDERKIVMIKNAVVKENIDSAEELMRLFMEGNVERHTGATKMNAESSRSHSIFAICSQSHQ